MPKHNPIHPEARLTFFKTPRPRRQFGFLHADPEASPGIVYVFNPEFQAGRVDPGIDSDLCESLKQIARAWPGRCVVFFLWLPDPQRWPLTTKLFIERFGARGIGWEGMEDEVAHRIAEAGG